MDQHGEALEMAPGSFLDEGEVAKILRVSKKTLANWRSLGEGPRFRKIGRRCVRYHAHDLSAFLNQGAP